MLCERLVLLYVLGRAHDSPNWRACYHKLHVRTCVDATARSLTATVGHVACCAVLLLIAHRLQRHCDAIERVTCCDVAVAHRTNSSSSNSTSTSSNSSSSSIPVQCCSLTRHADTILHTVTAAVRQCALCHRVCGAVLRAHTALQQHAQTTSDSGSQTAAPPTAPAAVQPIVPCAQDSGVECVPFTLFLLFSVLHRHCSHMLGAAHAVGGAAEMEQHDSSGNVIDTACRIVVGDTAMPLCPGCINDAHMYACVHVYVCGACGCVMTCAVVCCTCVCVCCSVASSPYCTARPMSSGSCSR